MINFAAMLHATNIIKKLSAFREQHISEQNYLYLLSIIVGILSAFAAIIIKKLVYLIEGMLTDSHSPDFHNYYFILFPVIGILFTLIIVKYIVKRDVGHLVPKILYAISKEKSNIRKHNMFSSIITSVLTVGFGGSVGLEGPTVGTGAAIGSNTGQFLKLDYKKKTALIACACAGGLAAMFKAPLAAIVFVVEVIMYNITTTSLIPILLASMSATLTSYMFFGTDVIYRFDMMQTFLMSEIPYYVILGVICGFVALYFQFMYHRISQLFDRISSWQIRFLVAASLLGILIFLFPSLYGEGYEGINKALQGDLSYLFNETLYYEYMDNPYVIMLLFAAIILLKTIATTITFSAGGVGGIFAPALFIGANLGLFFAFTSNLFQIPLNLGSFALVGMAGVFAGIIHAPMTAIFLIAETTGGHGLFMPLMITSTISYATVRIFTKNSVYTFQLAKRGELMTHDKDKQVLLLMNIQSIIEKQFITVDPKGSLRDLISAISRSNRNIFPVVDAENKLYGVIKTDHIRSMMFDSSLYDKVKIKELMTLPEFVINPNESMENVAKLFQNSSRYTIPVVEDGKYYVGFISRAKFFSAYRKLLAEYSED